MSAEIFRQRIEHPSDRVIVALDDMDWQRAETVMEEAKPFIGMAKANSIAQEKGWEHAMRTIANLGAFTMADTKFHDIPRTVGLQVESVARAGASLITVHASGGKKMLESAVEGSKKGKDDIANAFIDPHKDRLGGILGITVLTSLKEECQSIYGDEPKKKVLEFAKMGAEAGIDGIVCSGEELEAIRSDSSLDGLLAVVPGITPAWAQKQSDQKRVVTPSQAVQSGADYIVVGSAITRPPDRVDTSGAAWRIAEELREAL